MRGISTLNLLRNSSLAALLAISCQTAFSQTSQAGLLPKPTATCEIFDPTASTCPGVDITFETPNTTIATYGFSGDFEVRSANSPNASSDVDLESTPVSVGTTKRLNTFYFNAVVAGSVDYTFEVSGPANITSYSVYLQTEGTGGTEGVYYPVCTGTLDLQSSSEAKVCGTAAVPGSVQGRFRLVFVFEISGQGQQTIALDNFGSTLFSAGAALPVNFTGLSAKKAAKGTQLTWNVADEFNVSRYEVQKGSNAGDLKTIGIVFAGERTSYTFTDEQPSQGVSFYRIRSVDIDGKFKFSTVISFSNGRSAALLRAFPLPAQNQVTLQHGAIEGKAQISIASEDGRTVRRLVPAIGSMQTAIDLTGLKAGMYLLRLENSNGEVETLKLIKQ